MGKLILSKTYGIAPNNVLNSENLSFKAKGLYTYIQSKPDGWDFSVERICLQSKDGRESVAAGLKELELEGYLKRVPAINEKGQFSGYDYILYEKAQAINEETINAEAINAETIGGTTIDGKPVNGKAVNLSNKDYSKKDYSKKEKEKGAAEKFDFEKNIGATPQSILGEMAEHWLKIHPTYKLMADPIEDLPALRKIGEKIMKTPHFHSSPSETMLKFKTFCKAALSDDFWRTKPLKSFAYNIQQFLPLIDAIENGKTVSQFKNEKIEIKTTPEKINLDTRKKHFINGGAPIRL